MTTPRTLALLVFAAALAFAARSGANFDLPATKTPNADAEAAAEALNAGQWQRAVEGFSAALKAEPGNASFHNGLGYAYRKLGKMDLSFVQYREALRIDPELRSAHEYIGEAYLAVGDKAKAREHLAKLETLCKGKGCEEYQDLAKAIAQAK